MRRIEYRLGIVEAKLNTGGPRRMFSHFSKAVHKNFVEMSKGELFVVDVENLFEQYLAAFPLGTDPVFRKRTEHDCSCCKQFIRTLGKVVGIKGVKVVTVWDDLDVPSPYKDVSEKLAEAVRNAKILTVFRTKERKYGTDHNYDGVTNQRYDHFHGEVANRHYSKDAATKRGEQEAIFQVMKRGLTEIRCADLDTVIDLIDSNGLYRGEEHRSAIIGFRQLQADFTGAGKTDLFVWANLDNRNARFRNTVIGTLLTDLAEGKDIEVAVRAFETKVAPMNYKRPTAIITQKMVEQAVETLNTLGLGGAIYRRYAKLSDVSVNDVLFVDNESRSKMKDGVAMLLESSVNPEDITRLVVFDTWTLNCDRCHHDLDVRKANYDNVYLSSENVEPGQRRLIAMDHGLCFIRSGEDLTPKLAHIDKVQDEHVYGLFPEFRGRLRGDIMNASVERLREMDRATAEAMIATVPKEWEVTPEARKAWAELIYRRAGFVADHVEQWIETAVPTFKG